MGHTTVVVEIRMYFDVIMCSERANDQCITSLDPVNDVRCVLAEEDGTLGAEKQLHRKASNQSAKSGDGPPSAQCAVATWTLSQSSRVAFFQGILDSPLTLPCCVIARPNPAWI